MKNNEVTTAIVLETRTQKKDGTYPVKLRITYNRKQKYYATGHAFSEKDFERVRGDKPRKELKDAMLFLNSFEENAIDKINELSEFSFEAFEKIFRATNKLKNNVNSSFESAIKKLNSEERLGTAAVYTSTLKSLKAFSPKNNLAFSDITVDFLKNYEKWMISKEKSKTTIGMYLRNLRTLFNEAINDGEIRKEHYPFHKRGYQIPTGRNIKKALSLEDISKIFDYAIVGNSTEAFSKDLWIFSYLSNGMNLKDIALLRYRDLQKDKLIFIRAKTERTKRGNDKPIVVLLNDDSIRIIEKWGNKPILPSSYIFPILKNEMSPKEQRDKILQTIKTTNKYIKRIGLSVGIDKHITTYTARHSFSTVLKRSGASTELISELLGHRDLRTTESYLDSFEDSMKREYASKLTSFKKTSN